MQNDELLEPASSYRKLYKDKHLEITEKYFDDLVKQANVDIEGNRVTVKKYNETCQELNVLRKKLSNQKGLRVFLIILMVILIVACGIVAALSFMDSGKDIPIYVGVLCCVAAVIFLVGGILIIKKVINKKVKQLQAKIDELDAKAKGLLQEAWAQMAVLNSLYDWGIPGQLVEKAVPIIQMDKNFDPEKYEYLHEKYGLGENLDPQASTYYCQSGSILGNPFLLTRYYIQSWFDKVYEGTLTIHWTTTERTKDGTRTVHHSQTLHAYVKRPCPEYNFKTILTYGNDAAPNLTFSREPSGATGLDDKHIQKMVKRGAKKLDKKAQNAVKKGGNYTRLGNDEFEVLFGADDRDNEVEFRLLYTPLAQKNVLNLIKDPNPYGDDFYQWKEKELNYICSKHSQTLDYYGGPTTFVSYDYDYARKNFIDYNVNYFKGFFFDMAPLLSVPLYQQHKAREYIYKKKYKANVTGYEHESIANSFDCNLLRPNGSATPSILKTTFEGKQGVADKVRITANSFRAERRVTYVTKLGGDGRYHDVPVYWIEYIPIQSESYMAIEPKNSSRYEFNNLGSNKSFADSISRIARGNNYLYERGLFAALLAREFTSADITAINTAYPGSEVVTITKTAAQTAQEIALKILAEKEALDSIDTKVVVDNSDSVLNDENADTKEVVVDEYDSSQEQEQKESTDDDSDEE